MKHRQVVTLACAQGLDESHDDDASPGTRGSQLAPGQSVIFTDGQPRRIEARPHDDSPGAVGANDTVERGYFLRGGPVCGSWQAVAPGAAAITAAFVYDRATSVPLRVDAEDRFAIL